MDDEVFRVSSVQATYEVYYKVKTRLSEGGFNLCCFVTNSLELRYLFQKSEQQERQTSITEEEQSYTQATPGNKRETPVDVQKVMGVHWNFLEDLLVLPHCQGCCSRRTDQQRCCECVNNL